MKFSIEISQYHLFVNFVTIQIKIQKQTNKNFYFYRLLYVNRLRCGLIKNPDTENTCSIFAEYFPQNKIKNKKELIWSKEKTVDEEL
ncbi:hypothetical protein BpHYR1_028244 [Brachionus plicatilis]|uniref:Uncharacterized protein n=1 Tax=Brachionus plicatilis TaxID=10195 RepID=A0A3M7SSV9_BRAPC|nr:hypothetical protein BpHYR1_028244 [Brachionus plicatilis]